MAGTGENTDEGKEDIELCFAFCRAIGTRTKDVEDMLSSLLSEANLLSANVRISSLIDRQTFAENITKRKQDDEFLRYHTQILAGDLLRSATGRGDIGALLAIKDINRRREGLRAEAARMERRGIAFIVRSVMNPAEVELLRQVYGKRFFLISVFSDEETRSRHLMLSMSTSANLFGVEAEALKDHLLARDRGKGYGRRSFFTKVVAPPDRRPLRVDRTFELADLFLRSDGANLRDTSTAELKRFLSLILGSPRPTLRRDEYGMAFAYTARLRSGALGRPVGAAICSDEGALISAGMNDVAKPHGGQYWEDDPAPQRDIDQQTDASDVLRRAVFGDLVAQLLSGETKSLVGKKRLKKYQKKLADPRKRDRLIDRLLRRDEVQAAEFFDILEYGRTVHAEMAAISDAALRGVSVRGATLYCTTFPCHECARHIVAAGISRVVYVEPYPKSRVKQLFNTEIALLHEGEVIDPLDTRIPFEPFMGIAPVRQSDLFSWVPRKFGDVPSTQRTVLARQHNLPANDARPFSGRVVPWEFDKWFQLRPTLERSNSPQDRQLDHDSLVTYEHRLRKRTLRPALRKAEAKGLGQKTMGASRKKIFRDTPIEKSAHWRR